MALLYWCFKGWISHKGVGQSSIWSAVSTRKIHRRAPNYISLASNCQQNIWNLGNFNEIWHKWRSPLLRSFTTAHFGNLWDMATQISQLIVLLVYNHCKVASYWVFHFFFTPTLSISKTLLIFCRSWKFSKFATKLKYRGKTPVWRNQVSNPGRDDPRIQCCHVVSKVHRSVNFFICFVNLKKSMNFLWTFENFIHLPSFAFYTIIRWCQLFLEAGVLD